MCTFEHRLTLHGEVLSTRSGEKRATTFCARRLRRSSVDVEGDGTKGSRKKADPESKREAACTSETESAAAVDASFQLARLFSQLPRHSSIDFHEKRVDDLQIIANAKCNKMTSDHRSWQ